MGFSSLHTIFKLKGLSAISSNGHKYWKNPKSWPLHQPFLSFISAGHRGSPLVINDNIKIQLFKNACTLKEALPEGGDKRCMAKTNQLKFQRVGIGYLFVTSQEKEKQNQKQRE